MIVLLVLVAVVAFGWAVWPLDMWHAVMAYVAAYVLISVARRDAAK